MSFILEQIDTAILKPGKKLMLFITSLGFQLKSYRIDTAERNISNISQNLQTVTLKIEQWSTVVKKAALINFSVDWMLDKKRNRHNV